jgi:hypothetical protein
MYLISTMDVYVYTYIQFTMYILTELIHGLDSKLPGMPLRRPNYREQYFHQLTAWLQYLLYIVQYFTLDPSLSLSLTASHTRGSMIVGVFSR